MTNLPPDPTPVPSAITAFQAAHDRRDTATALPLFTADATVVDDGRTYVGIVEVETFLSTAASEYTYTRSLLAAEEAAPDRWLITNRLQGNFPGGQVDLTYEFRLADGLIASLTIAP
ncbi:MAG TPA: DUF4440 domain-containing protein [Acidimicrobiaceae bacterium]|nr:DUF4440 domain-containing protein [Acidimicrobiaceae bacterium]